MNKRFLTSSLACLVLGLAPSAWADYYITETYSFPTSPTPYNETISVQDLNLPYGTGYHDVDKITISSSLALTGSATMSNNNPSTRSVTHAGSSEYVTMSLLSGGHSTTANGNANAIVLANANPSSRVISSRTTFASSSSRMYSLNGSASTSKTYSGSSTKDSLGDTITGGGTTLINDFLGTGTTSVDLEGKAEISYAGDNGMTYTSTDDLSGTFTITFEVVPEPSTWMSAALLFGVVGASTGRTLWRKRRQPDANPFASGFGSPRGGAEKPKSTGSGSA